MAWDGDENQHSQHGTPGKMATASLQPITIRIITTKAPLRILVFQIILLRTMLWTSEVKL
jgi:hypothetical protein